MRIWLPTAPLEFRHTRADGGAVDNLNREGTHLRNWKFRPNKPSHFWDI